MPKPGLNSIVRRSMAPALAFVLALGPAATALARDAAVTDTLGHPRPQRRVKAPDQAPRERGPSYTLVLGIEWLNDDNILQLPPSDLARLASNPTPPRFLVTTPDDNVAAVHGDAYAHVQPLRRRDTRLGVSFDASSYARNDVKDWHQFGVSLQQELTASRRNLTALNAWWSSVPDYYLLQVTDADDSFAAGFRIRRSLTYGETTTGARLDQDLLRGRVKLAIGFERAERDYNAYFNERDNHNDQWRFSGEVRPFRGWGATARATFLTGTLRARGDLASSPIADADISYDHHGLGASVSLPWGRGRSRGRVDVSVMPQTRDYLTTDKFDLRRFGRENHRLETVVRVTQRVWGPFEAVATYDKLRSDAAFDSGLTFPEEETDFDQTQAGLMLRGRWELRPGARPGETRRP